MLKAIFSFLKRKRGKELNSLSDELASEYSDLREYPLLTCEFLRKSLPFVLEKVNADENQWLVVTLPFKNFEDLLVEIRKQIVYISNDQYEKAVASLNKHLTKPTNISISELHTDKKGSPVNPGEVWKELLTSMYSIASILDGYESSEYHRLMYMLYKEIVLMVRAINAA